MKNLLLTIILCSAGCFLKISAQEGEYDTLKFKIKSKEYILLSPKHDISNDTAKIHLDTIDASPSKEEIEDVEGHWAGFELGFGTLLNKQQTTDFGSHAYWKNDPARSLTFNFNFYEHKIDLYKNRIGLTTGFGLNFTQIAFRNNYVLFSNADSVFAIKDTVNNYSKNKLRAAYFTVPLLLEFCAKSPNGDGDDSFYFATGVIGGVRMTSRQKLIGEHNGKEFKQIKKGVYNLNGFKLDATVRVGYRGYGAFVTYSLLPVFDPSKTNEIHPLVVGLTHNF